jgi:ribonuclease BN (tRNA processing enzyme)
MDRRAFLKVSAASLAAAGIEGETFKAYASTQDNHSEDVFADMKIMFLGTGAADWKGRDKRGELRRLSSILVDKKVFFDLTATNLEMIPSECTADTIFYTHSHDDHYNPKVALKAGIKKVYLSHTWYDIAVSEFKRAAKELETTVPEIIPVYIGRPVEVEGLKVTPLPASHATEKMFEQTLMYLIEKNKARVIYATDTGGIPAMAARIAGIDAHERPGKPITGLIMEATMGLKHHIDYRMYTHSSIGDVERIVRVLEKTKRYTPDPGQHVYLTHMARTLNGTQAELDAELPSPLKAAYDGLEVVFKG